MNAEACRATGAALVLAQGDVTPGTVAAAAARLLTCQPPLSTTM